MQRFKTFLEESKKTPFSPRLGDFLDHLMSPVVSSHAHKLLQEVTLVDNLDSKKPKGKQVPVPDVLSHGAVTQRDSKEHVERHNRLMQNGQNIAKSTGNVYKGIKKGFDSYMDKVDARGPKQSDSTAAKKHHTQYRQENFGYGSSGAKFMGKNTKIAKNAKQSENSTGLSLAPYTMHGIPGHNTCVKATKECRNSCLAYTTGQNAMLSNINSKMAKHQYMAHHPEHAAAQIHHEMLKHVNDTIKENKTKGPDEKSTVGFRMNVTTDYHMRHMMGRMLDHVHQHAQSNGVEMKVRDYTKHAERLDQKKPDYHFMALSHTGTGHGESNDHDVGKALSKGHTVAAVVRGDATHFYDHKTKALHPIVDGDSDDMIENRHKEAGHLPGPNGTGIHPVTKKPAGVVSALRIKGISHKVKEAAGKFENQTTTINHPEHGKMNVVEINKGK